MSRARKTDEDQALEGAITAFWEAGYAALGTRELEARTGITRFTLQKSYAGKEALFLRALTAYLDRMDEMLFPPMHGQGLEGIATWFEARVTPELTPPDATNGCMMVNAIIEFAGSNDSILAAQSRYLSTLERNFTQVLQNAQQSGELSEGFDIESHAKALAGATLGLMTAIRAAPEFAQARPIAMGIATMIRGWSSAPAR